MAHTVEVEIERNYAAFKDIISDLLAEKNEGSYALMRDQRLQGIYSTAGAAARAGYAKYRDQPYSVQLISDEPVDLGFFSYALNQG